MALASPERDYLAFVTSRDKLCRDIRAAMKAAAAHACADPSTVQWRCNPFPAGHSCDGRYQLYVSWPCGLELADHPIVPFAVAGGRG